MSEMSEKIAFIDPHMHVWDFLEYEDVHDIQLLGGVRHRALLTHYSQEIEASIYRIFHYSAHSILSGAPSRAASRSRRSASSPAPQRN
jgi:hypothetical protein